MTALKAYSTRPTSARRKAKRALKNRTRTQRAQNKKNALDARPSKEQALRFLRTLAWNGRMPFVPGAVHAGPQIKHYLYSEEFDTLFANVEEEIFNQFSPVPKSEVRCCYSGPAPGYRLDVATH